MRLYLRVNINVRMSAYPDVAALLNVLCDYFTYRNTSKIRSVQKSCGRRGGVSVAIIVAIHSRITERSSSGRGEVDPTAVGSSVYLELSPTE